MGPNEAEYMKYYSKIPSGYSKYLASGDREFIFEQLLKIHRNSESLKPEMPQEVLGMDIHVFAWLPILIILLAIVWIIFI